MPTPRMPKPSPETLERAIELWSSAVVNGIEGMPVRELQDMRFSAGDSFAGAIIAGADPEEARTIAVSLHMAHIYTPQTDRPIVLTPSGMAGAASYLALHEVHLNAGGARG